jgi:hypothetical protein
VGFSCGIRKVSWRISRSTPGRPTRRRSAVHFTSDELPGADAYDSQQRTRVLRRLRQRATTLGFDLVNSLYSVVRVVSGECSTGREGPRTPRTHDANILVLIQVEQIRVSGHEKVHATFKSSCGVLVIVEVFTRDGLGPETRFNGLCIKGKSLYLRSEAPLRAAF